MQKTVARLPYPITTWAGQPLHISIPIYAKPMVEQLSCSTFTPTTTHMLHAVQLLSQDAKSWSYVAMGWAMCVKPPNQQPCIPFQLPFWTANMDVG